MVSNFRDLLKEGQRRDCTVVEIMRLCSTLTESERIDIVCELLGIDFAELYEMVHLVRRVERVELHLLAAPDDHAIARWADDGGASC